MWMWYVFSLKGEKRSVLTGESDDDSQPNTYDSKDSFIDDNDDGNTSM